jgi:hypothetical protein
MNVIKSHKENNMEKTGGSPTNNPTAKVYQGPGTKSQSQTSDTKTKAFVQQNLQDLNAVFPSSTGTTHRQLHPNRAFSIHNAADFSTNADLPGTQLKIVKQEEVLNPLKPKVSATTVQGTNFRTPPPKDRPLPPTPPQQQFTLSSYQQVVTTAHPTSRPINIQSQTSKQQPESSTSPVTSPTKSSYKEWRHGQFSPVVKWEECNVNEQTDTTTSSSLREGGRRRSKSDSEKTKKDEPPKTSDQTKALRSDSLTANSAKPVGSLLPAEDKARANPSSPPKNNFLATSSTLSSSQKRLKEEVAKTSEQNRNLENSGESVKPKASTFSSLIRLVNSFTKKEAFPEIEQFWKQNPGIDFAKKSLDIRAQILHNHRVTIQEDKSNTMDITQTQDYVLQKMLKECLVPLLTKFKIFVEGQLAKEKSKMEKIEKNISDLTELHSLITLLRDAEDWQTFSTTIQGTPEHILPYLNPLFGGQDGFKALDKLARDTAPYNAGVLYRHFCQVLKPYPWPNRRVIAEALGRAQDFDKTIIKGFASLIVDNEEIDRRAIANIGNYLDQKISDNETRIAIRQALADFSLSSIHSYFYKHYAEFRKHFACDVVIKKTKEYFSQSVECKIILLPSTTSDATTSSTPSAPCTSFSVARTIPVEIMKNGVLQGHLALRFNLEYDKNQPAVEGQEADQKAGKGWKSASIETMSIRLSDKLSPKEIKNWHDELTKLTALLEAKNSGTETKS